MVGGSVAKAFECLPLELAVMRIDMMQQLMELFFLVFEKRNEFYSGLDIGPLKIRNVHNTFDNWAMGLWMSLIFRIASSISG